jgi:hypothetical protein
MLAESLHDALADQRDRQQDRQRQQDVECRAHQIDPEVAQFRRFALHETARQGDQHRHAGRGRDEVLHGQAEHLRQVAHRRLAAVRLPVGVGSKAGGGIEGQVGRRRRHAVRIERQHVLQALQCEHGEEAEQVEEEDSEGIARPRHRVVVVTPARR